MRGKARVGLLELDEEECDAGKRATREQQEEFRQRRTKLMQEMEEADNASKDHWGMAPPQP